MPFHVPPMSPTPLSSRPSPMAVGFPRFFFFPVSKAPWRLRRIQRHLPTLGYSRIYPRAPVPSSSRCDGLGREKRASHDLTVEWSSYLYIHAHTYIHTHTHTHTHVRVGSGAVEGGSELHFSSCPWRSVLLVLVSMYTGKRAILPNLTESIGETQRCGLKHVQLPTCRPRLCIKLQANTHGPVGEQSEIDMQCSLVPVPAAGSWKPSLVGPGISDMKQYVYVRSVASCLLLSHDDCNRSVPS